MKKIDFIIDASLSEKFACKSDEFIKAKTAVLQNIKEIENILEQSSLSFEMVQSLTDFYKVKNKILSNTIFQEMFISLTNTKEEKALFIPLIKTICLIDFINNEETQNNINTFLASLCKKATVSAAELGDEKNIHFLKACIKVIDYSFIKILEQNKISFKKSNIDINQTITPEFKTQLWTEIDKNISLLKILKTEVFGDKNILSEFNHLDITKTETTKKLIDLDNS